MNESLKMNCLGVLWLICGCLRLSLRPGVAILRVRIWERAANLQAREGGSKCKAGAQEFGRALQPICTLSRSGGLHALFSP